MKKWVFYLMCMWGVLCTNALAGENPKAVVIFDASGSMWGQIAGKSKIEIAKNVLKDVVNEWNPKIELGLTVYGHRTKGDCDDIQSVIPAAIVDKEKMIATVLEIQPKGKTPISRSLKKVANELRYTEEKSTIILISDGKETCDPDPCATAKQLEEKGIDFVAHVIGFNVDKKTDTELACIASVTGGEYFSAKDASALNAAMKSIVKKVEDPKPIPKPVIKKTQYNVEISASETDEGKWVKAKYDIFKLVDDKQSSIKGCRSTEKEPCKIAMDAGAYLIKAEYSDHNSEKKIEVNEKEVSKVHFVMVQTGVVEISVSEKEKGKWVKARGDLFKEDGHRIDGFGTSPDKPKQYKLAVGKYYVNIGYTRINKENIPFEIKAGEVSKLHVVMGQTGSVEISVSEKEKGKWVKASGSLFKDDGDRIDGFRTSPDKPKQYKLAVGKYYVNMTYNHINKDNVAFDIKAGEVTKLNVAMGQTGTVSSTARERGGRQIRAVGHVYAIDSDGKKGKRIVQIRTERDKPETIILPIGKYVSELKYMQSHKDVNFEIKAGEETKLHVVFYPVLIQAKCTDASSKADHAIYNQNGRLVYNKSHKCSDEIKVVLDTGEYSLESTLDTVTRNKSFSVDDVHPNTINIEF